MKTKNKSKRRGVLNGKKKLNMKAVSPEALDVCFIKIGREEGKVCVKFDDIWRSFKNALKRVAKGVRERGDVGNKFCIEVEKADTVFDDKGKHIPVGHGRAWKDNITTTNIKANIIRGEVHEDVKIQSTIRFDGFEKRESAFFRRRPVSKPKGHGEVNTQSNRGEDDSVGFHNKTNNITN